MTRDTMGLLVWIIGCWILFAAVLISMLLRLFRKWNALSRRYSELVNAIVAEGYAVRWDGHRERLTLELPKQEHR